MKTAHDYMRRAAAVKAFQAIQHTEALEIIGNFCYRGGVKEQAPYQPDRNPSRPAAGESSPGLPARQPERSQPKPEHTASETPSGLWGKIRNSRGTLDCPIPRTILSPFDIQRMYDHQIPKEQAIEEGQAWVESLKEKGTQRLEQMLDSLEKFKQEDFSSLREKYRTPQQAELLEYEMGAIREQLRLRGDK